MKMSNAPARKVARRIAAQMRETVPGTTAREVLDSRIGEVIDARAIRTKKDRSSKGRVRAA